MAGIQHRSQRLEPWGFRGPDTVRLHSFPRHVTDSRQGPALTLKGHRWPYPGPELCDKCAKVLRASNAGNACWPRQRLLGQAPRDVDTGPRRRRPLLVPVF